MGAVEPRAVAARKDGAQCVASARRTQAAFLRNTWAYDKGLVGQQLGLWKAMLALALVLLVLTRRKRLASAVGVLLVAGVLYS